MWKAYIRVCTLLALLSLAACASGPGSPTGSEQNVGPQAKAEFAQAIQAIKDGRDNDAQRLLTELTQKYSKLAGPFINLGLIYMKEGEYAKAKQALLQATTIRPDDAVAFNQLGVAYRNLGELKQAQQAYQQALKLKPDYADAHLNIGILYDVYLNELPKALVHYEKYQALEGNPKNEVAKWIIDLKRRVSKMQTKAAS